MRPLRRRLASCALALLVLQGAMVFAAPLSACCAPRASAAGQIATLEDGECCPPGSHPPGECPLHKDRKAAGSPTSRASQCRIVCDGPHGSQLLLTAIGVLPPPVSTDITLVSTAIAGADAVNPASGRTFPHAPPPKRL